MPVFNLDRLYGIQERIVQLLAGKAKRVRCQDGWDRVAGTRRADGKRGLSRFGL